jgi:hypothetical protein
VKPQRFLAVIAVMGMLAAGCSDRSDSDGEQTPAASAAPAVSGDFGDLKSVCRPGKATSAPAQGVTASEIKVGVFTDLGFTSNPEFVDAAKVFTSWCNAAGGINGRKLVPVTRDAKLMESRQRMLESCGADFAVVGGGSGLDALGVKDRLTCLLPDFSAQVAQIQNTGADLQVLAGGAGPGYDPYQGYLNLLLKDA